MKDYTKQLSKIYLILFLIFITMCQLFQGLYFRNQFLGGCTFIGFIFAFFIYNNFTNKDYKPLNTKIDYLLLIMLLLYIIIAIFTSIAKMEALDAILKMLAIFMVYQISCKHAKANSPLMFLGFYFIGTIVSLTSLMAGSKIINIEGVFIFGKRLAGVYQYSNTLAIVLGAFFLIGLIQAIPLKNKWLKSIFLVSQIILMVGFIATKSRGATLIFILVWLGNTFLLKGKNKLQYLFSSVSLLACSIAAYFVYNKAETPLYFIIFTLTVIILSILLFYFSQYVQTFIVKANEVKILKVLVCTFLTLILSFIICFNIREPLTLNKNNLNQYYEVYNLTKATNYKLTISANLAPQSLLIKVISMNQTNNQKTLINTMQKSSGSFSVFFKTPIDSKYITIGFINNKPLKSIIVSKAVITEKLTGKLIKAIKLKSIFLPADITEKLSEINLKTATSSERGYFYKDAIKLWLDYPILGAGEGSYERLNQKYQSYNYKTKNVHSFYLQLLTETGLLGLIIMLVIIVISYKNIFILYKDSIKQLDVVSLFNFITMLLVHSIIDVNFMYFAIWLLLFVSIAMLMALTPEKTKTIQKHIPNKLIKIILSVLTIIYIATTISLTSGIAAATDASASAQLNLENSINSYIDAMFKDPLNSENRLAYNKLLFISYLQTNNINLKNELQDNFNKLKYLDNYNLEYKSLLANFYFNTQNYKACLQALNSIIELNPLEPLNYEEKASYSEQIFLKAKASKDYALVAFIKKDIQALSKEYNNALKNKIYYFKLTPKTITIINRITENK